MIERLNLLYGAIQSDDRVLVVIHADPDAISSALALKRVLWRRVASVTIAHSNTIKRADNLAMIELLKIPIVSLRQVDPKTFTRRAIVDSQPPHYENLNGMEFDLIIDHHPLGGLDAPFIDVRPDYGATATIMTEYLRAAKIVPSRNLSTALFYGIKTDTNNFARQGQLEDMRAFRFLFPYTNKNLINKIENSEMTRAMLKYFQIALARFSILKGLASVHLGQVDNSDILVLLADFFMKVYEINQSLVTGIVRDHLIIILRTAGIRKDAGRLLSSAFGEFGSAGGHRTMARAEIPLANLDPRLLDKNGALERFIRKQIQNHWRPPKAES
ncbi:MAG: DHH family phosphoesterase [Deltaproteobacteria bacterium]|nr:DHH family phosphoesterase [Deltaproteobacteria bacterium]MBW2141957.1 DHH family phosphoesterase [Deltaproteobacteria bacterium]